MIYPKKSEIEIQVPGQLICESKNIVLWRNIDGKEITYKKRNVIRVSQNLLVIKSPLFRELQRKEKIATKGISPDKLPSNARRMLEGIKKNRNSQ